VSDQQKLGLFVENNLTHCRTTVDFDKMGANVRLGMMRWNGVGVFPFRWPFSGW
jgi:hypothetical protein